jgi:hypothetical protein
MHNGIGKGEKKTLILAWHIIKTGAYINMKKFQCT